MSKVYIVQSPTMRDKKTLQIVPKLDFSSAKEFGELVFCLHAWESKPEIIIWNLRDKLKDFTKEDYLIPTGNPTAIIAAGIIAAKLCGGMLNILLFDRELNNRMGGYRLSKYNFGNTPEYDILINDTIFKGAKDGR